MLAAVATSLSHQETVVLLAACSLTLVAVLLLLFLISRHWQDPDKGMLSDSVHLMEGGHRGGYKGHIVDHIKLSSVVGEFVNRINSIPYISVKQCRVNMRKEKL